MMIFENQADKLIFIHAQFLHQSFLIGLQSCTFSQIVSFLLCDKFTIILLRPHKLSFPVLVGQAPFEVFSILYKDICIYFFIFFIDSHSTFNPVTKNSQYPIICTFHGYVNFFPLDKIKRLNLIGSAYKGDSELRDAMFIDCMESIKTLMCRPTHPQ